MTGRASRQTGQSLLGIYLNDHLAGATGGAGLARRMAASGHIPAAESVMRGLAVEIAQDRGALLGIMAGLGVPVRSYKLYAAWIGEKAGRLKLNGRLLARSPSATWRSWNCSGWAWRARPRDGERFGC